MLKMFLMSSVVAASVIFTGCASKDASTAQNVTGASSSASKSSDSGVNSVVTPSSSASSGLDSAINTAHGKIKSVLFDFDKFNIKADMQPVVDENSKVVSDKSVESAKIKLEGNADERGTDEYNYALALKRAEAVKSVYTSKGIPLTRITTVSLGEGNPVCKDSAESCWSKNRRVDTKLEK